ncbi:MAG: hypothetical protein KF809_18025 [Chloroflexi bacterium]|nr:hypothetical protein [Chloroflexota bacterium]
MHDDEYRRLAAAGRIRLGAPQRRTLIQRDPPRVGGILEPHPGSEALAYLIEWVSEPRVHGDRTFWTVRYRAVVPTERYHRRR